MHKVSVNCFHDEEANVWIAASDDVPGLVMESESLDSLLSRCKKSIPELLEINEVLINYSIRRVIEL